MLSLSWQSLYYNLYYMQALGLDRATLVAGGGGGWWQASNIRRILRSLLSPQPSVPRWVNLICSLQRGPDPVAALVTP